MDKRTIIQQTRPIKIKPIMYPPVLPSRMPIPEVKCANTGTPNAPSNTYKIIDTVPRLPPKAGSMKNTAKVCIVNGTVVGMLIQEHTEIRTAPNAMQTKSIVLKPFFISFLSFIINFRSPAKLKPLAAGANFFKFFCFKNPFPSFARSFCPRNIFSVGKVADSENGAVH